MTQEHLTPESSMLAKIVWTKDGTLQVHFKNGKVYEYEALFSIYIEMCAAESAGSYYNKFIKRQFKLVTNETQGTI